MNKRRLSDSIVYISDLHIERNYQWEEANHNMMRKYANDYDVKNPDIPRSRDEYVDRFIGEIKCDYAEDVVIMAGDLCEGFANTLDFVQRLEEREVYGFFVLGNHDYWNNGDYSYDDVIAIFKERTRENNYFRYLYAGQKEYVDDLCIIGDSGWSSFRRSIDGVGTESLIDDATSVLSTLPEWSLVSNFSLYDVKQRHDKWIVFANSVIKQEKNLLVVTHWPMMDMFKYRRAFMYSGRIPSRKDALESLWWSSYTDLIDGEYWNIYGHTHQLLDKVGNHIASQVGYHTSILRNNSMTLFGSLVRVRETGLVNQSIVANIVPYYDPYSVTKYSETSHDFAVLSEKIKRRGYRRASMNKGVLIAYAQDPIAYINTVEGRLWNLMMASRGAYMQMRGVTLSQVNAVQEALVVLRSGDTANSRLFMTSLVITGYVYNMATWALRNMRPLDDYDILRFMMVLKTIMGLDMLRDGPNIKEIRRNTKMSYDLGGVRVYGPSVNGQSLPIEVMDAAVAELIQSSRLGEGIHLLE